LLRVHNLKKFDNTGEDLEDLISIGTIGLIKAIESFSLNKGTKLATFAARCIENEIHLRSLKKTRKDVSLHDPIGTDKEGNEITLIDILGTEADDVVDKVQLTEERTQREIAKELGINRSYVSRIEKRALMKLYHRTWKSFSITIFLQAIIFALIGEPFQFGLEPSLTINGPIPIPSFFIF
jgi:RNA polymerase sporulation-specific sigma factor